MNIAGNANLNNLQQFKTVKNINMLWEVLLDELNINTQNTSLTANVRSVFESNINPFLARANPNSGLMNLNKIFLTQIVAAVNRLFPNINQQPQVKLINISDEVVSSEPYKVEDIHNARQTEFETQVNQRRNDFENLVTVKKPKELDFSDKAETSKIKEMEALIAETIAKRNFDIEQINTNMNMSVNVNADTGQTPDEWLKPNNTSLRVEKQQPLQKDNDIGQRKHKYVNTMEQNTPFLTKSDSATPLKKVSFNDNNNVTMTIEEYMEPQAQEVINIPTNIFNKLKKVEEPIKTPEPNMQSQINDMNKKIDTLFAMMTELSSNVKQIVTSKQDN
jgi:hypothetical protein